jgi:hypothetical protein
MNDCQLTDRRVSAGVESIRTDHQFQLLRSDIRESEASVTAKIGESQNTVTRWVVSSVLLGVLIQVGAALTVHFLK